MQDLALILLVNGKEDFTKRWLKYMSKIEFKHKIVIGNGNKKSNLLIKELIKKKIYSNLNIEYHSYNNKNYKDYYFMMYDVVKKQKETRYIKFCDNDDFILPNQLENLLDLVKKDRKLVSVGDRDLWFSLIGSNLYNKYIYFFPDNFYRSVENFNTQNIKSVFTNFQESFYNIFTKKYILQILKEIHQINFSDLEIRDFYLKLRIMMFGKTKFYNQVSYVRQHGVSQTSSNFLYTRSFIHKDISGDIKKLKKNIFKKIKKSSSNKDMIINEIENGYVSYLNIVIQHNLRQFNHKKLFIFKKFLQDKFKTIYITIRKAQYLKINLLLKKNYFKNYLSFRKELELVKKFLKD
jgi:glycosyltransferase domain-containing protein